jgi:hypothetical protein
MSLSTVLQNTCSYPTLYSQKQEGREMTKSDEITKLLAQGKTSHEIISMGYKKGTVFGAQRKFRQNNATPHVTNNKVAQAKKPPPIKQPINTTIDIESDPEIVQLKKEIRIAELRKQLGIAKAPSEMEVLIAAALQCGELRQEECEHKENGVCALYEWSSREDIEDGIGEPIPKEKDKWRIKPSPLYCAMCTANIEDNIEDLEYRLRRLIFKTFGTGSHVNVEQRG